MADSRRLIKNEFLIPDLTFSIWAGCSDCRTVHPQIASTTRTCFHADVLGGTFQREADNLTFPETKAPPIAPTAAPISGTFGTCRGATAVRVSNEVCPAARIDYRPVSKHEHR